LNNPKPDPEELDKSLFVLMRHAYSNYNNAARRYELIPGKDDKDAGAMAHRLSKDFIDCSLHKYGVLQAKLSQKIVNEIDFAVVFVSPLRRAMQTSYYLFETHPNRTNIRFIVLPLVRECLDTSNDIPNGTTTTLLEEFSNKNGVAYDFSLIKSLKVPELWTYEVLTDESKKKSLYERTVKKSDGTYNDDEILIEEFGKYYPEKFESWGEIRDRAQVAKVFLKKWAKENPQAPGKKIGVVSHSAFLSSFTSKGMKNNELDGFYYFNNCEVKPFEF